MAKKKKKKQSKNRLTYKPALIMILALLGCVWFTLDRFVKFMVESGYQVGEIILPSNGIFQFDLVHNTGAAWGMFGESTTILTTITVVILFGVMCAAIYETKRGTKLEMVGFALILAGGLGNLLDRLAFGYVVDFITPTFIAFPTFNIADIGVTCGVIVLAVSLLLQARNGRF